MIPEPQLETVVIQSNDEWDAAVAAYEAKGWVLAAASSSDRGTRLTFVPKPQGETSTLTLPPHAEKPA